MDVDVAIIGAGTAGIAAFKEASKFTKKLVLIDHGPLGTTCARIGCMPSKVFIQIADYFHDRIYFAKQGIQNANQLTVSLPEVMQYVRKMRDDFTAGNQKYISSLNDYFICGDAEFLDLHHLKVNNTVIHAKKIIIATGSYSVIPPEWKNLSDQLLTSENFFEQKTFTKNIAVIGGGGIGLELGQALSRLGVEINLFHASSFIANLTDPKVNACAIEILQQEFSLFINQKANVEKKENFIEVKSETQTLHTQSVLAALGRKPNVEHLQLEKIGIKIDKKGQFPHDCTTMQIKDLPIFFAGDVSNRIPLLHEAADDGRIAGYNATHDPVHGFQRRTPLSIIFTQPNIATVGKSFKELQDENYIVGEAQFADQGRARIMSKNKGLLRIYADPEQGRLLGAEMIAPCGEHLAHLLAWAIQQQMTVFDALQMPFYHPVVEEGMRTALRDLAKQVKNVGQKTLELVMCDSSAAPNLS